MIDELEFDNEERELLGALAQLSPIGPPGDIRERFRERAETERAVGPGPRRWVTVALAAALVLTIGGGWWIDRGHEQRAIEKLQMAVARLSVTSRYEWATAVADSGAGDSPVVAALTKALLSDSSTNVRVAAAEALGRIATPATLRTAAERSIRSDSSPFVQAALLGAMTRLTAGDRATLIHILLSRPDLDPVVRAEAEAKTKS